MGTGWRRGGLEEGRGGVLGLLKFNWCPALVHLWLPSWLLHLNVLPFPWCNILYTCSQCWHIGKLVYNRPIYCFLKFALVNIFFASVIFFSFFYAQNSLNHVRICTSAPYSVLKDLQKQDCVIAWFSCYSTKTKIWSMYKIVENLC